MTFVLDRLHNLMITSGDYPTNYFQTWWNENARRLEKVLNANEIVAPGGSGTINFTNIPSTYRRLRLEWIARGDAATTSVDIRLQINGDSGGNYDYVVTESNSAAPSTTSGISSTFLLIGSIPAATAVANESGSGKLELPEYAGVFRKNGNGLSNFKTADSSGGPWNRIHSVWWRNTAAITSLSLVASSGNFVSGSKFRLYYEN